MRKTWLAAGGWSALISLGPGAHATPGFTVGTEVQQQKDVSIFLTIGKGAFVQGNGQPWVIPAGTSKRFSGNLTVSDVNAHPPMPIQIPATSITDYHLHVGGVPIPGNFPVTINDTASSNLDGEFLGMSAPFGFLPLALNLPLAPGLPVDNFLTDLNGDGVISAADDIFVAVNLSQWEPSAFAAALGTAFIVSQGRDSALPGYYFSLDPISIDASSGFVSSQPFSGTAYASGLSRLSSIPEPGTLLMLGPAIV